MADLPGVHVLHGRHAGERHRVGLVEGRQPGDPRVGRVTPPSGTRGWPGSSSGVGAAHNVSSSSSSSSSHHHHGAGPGHHVAVPDALRVLHHLTQHVVEDVDLAVNVEFVVLQETTLLRVGSSHLNRRSEFFQSRKLLFSD